MLFGEQLELWDGVDARAEPWGGRSPRDLTRWGRRRTLAARAGDMSCPELTEQLDMFPPQKEKGPEGAPSNTLLPGLREGFRKGGFFYLR